MKELIKEHLKKAISYEDYRKMAEDLVDQKKTTGPNQSEEMVHYTMLNHKRMERLDKTINLTDLTKSNFQSLKGDYIWLVISEPWCGDASQIVPVFSAIANLSPSIEIKIVLRDENPVLMDKFEINGSRAIPVLIMVEKSSYDIVGVWGARPKPAQSIVNEYKNSDPKPPYAELSQNLQKWYNQDKTMTIQEELVAFTKEI